DGWSKGVLYRELSALYDAFAAGRASPPAEPLAQYGDFAEWQRARFTDEMLAGELDYWREQLEGAPTAIDLPADRPRPPVASLRGARLRQSLPPELTRR